MKMEHTLQCPHCGVPLDEITLPDGSGWEETPHWVCFNDECSYFRDGWDWMWTTYEIRASYRYRITNQANGKASPLAVWSDTAVRDRIVQRS